MSGINVKFGATDAGFTSTVSKVNGSMKGLDSNVSKVSASIKTSFAGMVKAGAALAVGFGAIKLAAGAITSAVGNFKDALDFGGELSDLSDQTGETAGNLLILRRAFDNSGVGADKVGMSINKMQKMLTEASQGSDDARENFGRLGLSWSEMQAKAPMEQLKMLAEAITSIPDPAARAAMAIEWFGKSGGRALAFLQDFSGSVSNAKEELGSMPALMDKNARVFDTISDKIAVINGKFKEFAAGVLSEMTPLLEVITTGLAGIDATAFGKRLADAFIGGTAAMDGFAMSLKALKVGEFSLAWSAAWESIKLQGAQTVNSIYVNIKGAIGAAIEFLKTSFGPGSGIWMVIDTGFKMLGNSISVSIGNSLKSMVAAIPGIGEKLAAGMSENIAAIEAESKILGYVMGFAAKKISGDFETAAQDATAAFQNIKKNTGEIIDTTGMKADLKDVTDKINTTAAGLTFNMMDDVKKLPASTFQMKDHLETGARAMAKAAKKVKETLTLSQEIVKKIKEAEGKDKVDPGGRLEKRAGEQIEKGRFRSAARTAGKIARGEQELQIQAAFGGDSPRAFGKSIQDLAKEQGIDTFRKTSKQLREELAERARQRGGELDARKQGKTEAEAKRGGKSADDPMTIISKAVEEIRTLVKKIEPKLPTAALAN